MKALATLVLIIFAMFALAYGAYYGADKQLCAQRGYDGHVMDFPLDGSCYFSTREGTQIYLPVEDVIREGLRSPKRIKP